MASANHTTAGTSRSDDPEEDRYRAARRACAKVALALIRTEESVAALVKYAEHLVPVLPAEDRRSIEKADEVPAWVASFIKWVGHILRFKRSSKIKCDAKFEPLDWSKDGGKWDAKQAGVMHISRFVRCSSMLLTPLGESLSCACTNKHGAIKALESVIKADTRAEYGDLLFSIGLAVARQMARCFYASFIAAHVEILDNVSSLWEEWTLGGRVTYREKPGHPHGEHQAGTPWFLPAKSWNGPIRGMYAPYLTREMIPSSKASPASPDCIKMAMLLTHLSRNQPAPRRLGRD
jgi:hypothetical protein